MKSSSISSGLRSKTSGGKIACVTRAIVKANESVNRVSSSSGAAATDSISALAKALKKEDVNVHIDLPAIVKCSLRDLPWYCYPKSVAVDYLATEGSKLRKKGIEKPFVYVDLRHFYLNGWRSRRVMTPPTMSRHT